MTEIERRQAERILEQTELSASDLKFLKKVFWQDSVFVMASQTGLKPHELIHFIRETRKPKDSEIEMILECLLLKLIPKPQFKICDD